MSDEHDERRLRRALGRLRAEDEARAPGFERVLAPRPSRRRARSVLAGAALALAVAFLAWGRMHGRPETQEPPVDLGAFYWQSPTDSLLLPADDPAAVAVSPQTSGRREP